MLVVALMAASCSSDSSTPQAGGTTTTGVEGSIVTVGEREFEMSLDPRHVADGVVTFQITNDGTTEHEFVLVETDLAADALPTDEEGAVDESGEGMEAVDEVEDIAVGSTESLTVTLGAGSYVAFCNLPGHYAGGMHAGFTVT